MNSFSHSIDIKRFKICSTRRSMRPSGRQIQRLLTDERDKAALEALDAKKN